MRRLYKGVQEINATPLECVIGYSLEAPEEGMHEVRNSIGVNFDNEYVRPEMAPQAATRRLELDVSGKLCAESK